MLSTNDLQTLERRHFSAICAASETGGLSLAEVADESARLTSLLLHEYRSLHAQHERTLSSLRTVSALGSAPRRVALPPKQLALPLTRAS